MGKYGLYAQAFIEGVPEDIYIFTRGRTTNYKTVYNNKSININKTPSLQSINMLTSFAEEYKPEKGRMKQILED